MIVVIITISLFCLELRTITDKGKILYPLRQLAVKYLPNIIHKPLLTCAPCMASVWGTVIYFTFLYQTTADIPEYILCTIGACYTNFVGWLLVEMIIITNNKNNGKH